MSDVLPANWDDPTLPSTGPSSVSVIDIAPFFGPDPLARAHVVDTVATACETSGFLVITGHGVPQRRIDEMYGVTEQFFALPVEEKMRVVSPVGEMFEAYCPLGRRLSNGKGQPNLVEMFHSSRYDTSEEAIANGYPVDIGASIRSTSGPSARRPSPTFGSATSPRWNCCPADSSTSSRQPWDCPRTGSTTRPTATCPTWPRTATPRSRSRRAPGRCETGRTSTSRR